MTDPMVEKLREILGRTGTLPICPLWMYESIRHCQRNMDFDVQEGFHEPDRYAGEPIAELLNLLPEIIAALEGGAS